MSDGRWSDVEADTAATVRHFSRAVEIYRQPGLHADTIDGYMRRMAFMHAMLAGHTSLEKVFAADSRDPGWGGADRAPVAR